MANIKISELEEITTLADNDVLPIVDTSENETKKVKKGNIVNGLVKENTDAVLTNVVSRNLLNLLYTSNVPYNVLIESVTTNSVIITAETETYSRININIHLKAGTYTLSGLYKLLAGNETNLKASTVLIFSDNKEIAQGSLNKLTFTLSKETDIEIRLLIFTVSAGTSGTKVQFYNLQLEENNIKTDYTPYFNMQELQENNGIAKLTAKEFISLSSGFSIPDISVCKQGKHIFGYLTVLKSSNFTGGQENIGTLKYAPTIPINLFGVSGTGDYYGIASNFSYVYLALNSTFLVKAKTTERYVKCYIDYVTN